MIIGNDERKEITTPPPDPPLALKSPIRFGARMLGVIFLLQIVSGLLILLPLSFFISVDELLSNDTVGEEIFQGGTFFIVLSFFLLPIETFLGQGGPIWLLSKFNVRNLKVLCILSAVCFGLLHYSSGPYKIFSSFLAGLVLSHCWLSWRVKSLGLAFWGTTLVHVGNNAIAFILLGLLTSLIPDPPAPPLPEKEPPAYLDRVEQRGVLQMATGKIPGVRGETHFRR